MLWGIAGFDSANHANRSLLLRSVLRAVVNMGKVASRLSSQSVKEEMQNPPRMIIPTAFGSSTGNAKPTCFRPQLAALRSRNHNRLNPWVRLCWSSGTSKLFVQRVEARCHRPQQTGEVKQLVIYAMSLWRDSGFLSLEGLDEFASDGSYFFGERIKKARSVHQE